jgi:transposase-like protein
VFKREAASQVLGRGHSVASLAVWLGVSTKMLYNWTKRYGEKGTKRSKEVDELKAVKADLKRVTEERDMPKKGRCEFYPSGQHHRRI